MYVPARISLQRKSLIEAIGFLRIMESHSESNSLDPQGNLMRYSGLFHQMHLASSYLPFPTIIYHHYSLTGSSILPVFQVRTRIRIVLLSGGCGPDVIRSALLLTAIT